MDKRQKILVVEDYGPLRDTLAVRLDLRGYRVSPAASLEEAMQHLDILEFDLALIDIMLNGPDDLSNRDGLAVLKRVKRSGSLTKALVLSGQPDPQLSADIGFEYRADGYLSKVHENAEPLLERVGRMLRSKGATAREPEWGAIVSILSPGEDEGAFVHEAMRHLAFGGGFAMFQGLIRDAVKWLHPMLSRKDLAATTLPSAPHTRSISLWSKGQGRAVDLILFNNKSVSRDTALDDEAGNTILYEKSKGPATALVVDRPDLSRTLFTDEAKQ